MDLLKSIAVPVKRRHAAKLKQADQTTIGAVVRSVGGNVGERRRQPGPTAVRPLHIYRVGQRLTLTPGGRDILRAAALCQVVALVPHETGPLRYRVRSDAESFERIVDEVDLTPTRESGLD